MTDWKPDLRHRKTVGDFTLTPERRGNETAHLIERQDGEGLRALPSDEVSGLRRSQTIVGVLLALEDVGIECNHGPGSGVLDHRVFDPFDYLVGVFTRAGMPWERVSPRTTPGDWVEEYLAGPVDRDAVADFLRSLGRAGFEIVEAG